MKCPYCNEDDDKVVDSRAAEGGRSIRRRRECLRCKRRFTTYEHVETTTRMMVIKKDGSRVPYDRQKMLDGLQKACYKRQVPAERILEIVDETEEELFRKHEREVQSMEIGRMLAERLKRVDQVAYVRFASVYKEFRDLDDFLDEVREVLETSQRSLPGQGELFNK
jgi:transcriptional repressor NrdR